MPGGSNYWKRCKKSGIVAGPGEAGPNRTVVKHGQTRETRDEKTLSIYVEIDPGDFLGHMFNACSIDQVDEFKPEKRGFRIHGHSTTIRLERVFWTVLEDMSDRTGTTLPALITRIHDQCLVANDKNISSCLRVICMKYMNIYA